MNKTNLTITIGALLVSLSALSETTAITNATVYTSTEKGILNNATLLIENGKIKAINPETVNADVIIDAKQQILTAGFIGSMNQLGLVEVGAVSRSRDAADKKAGLDFDASSAFNSRSSLIAYARKGGITQNIVAVRGGESIFSGLAFVADLSGEFDSITDKHTALLVSLGAKSKGSRAMSFDQFSKKLDSHQTKLTETAKKKKDDKKPTKSNLEERVLTGVVSGDIPVVVKVNRANDILQVLKIKDKFNLNIILHGANDAVLVKSELAKAKVPVILSAMSNLPSDFDSLHANLENAGILEQAGVKVILSVKNDGSHNVYQLRYDAGNAVSYGMSRSGALKAVTSNISDAFGIDGGKIQQGERADLVLWSADPFEISSHVSRIWINGLEVSTQSRHDKLRERYTTESTMPHAYTK